MRKAAVSVQMELQVTILAHKGRFMGRDLAKTWAVQALMSRLLQPGLELEGPGFSTVQHRAGTFSKYLRSWELQAACTVEVRTQCGAERGFPRQVLQSLGQNND